MIDIPAPPPGLSDDAISNEESQIDSGSYIFRDEAILGTRMRIDLVARNISDAQAAALSARREIDRLNAILNSRDRSSEISVLNRSRVHQASPELFAVIEAAERWRDVTSGAFSPRLGRTIALWQQARDRAPCRAELAELTCAAEAADVTLDRATRTITRPDAVVFAVDALAKGWIVDRAFEVVRSAAGVAGALVEIGGDIRCGGRAPDGRGWNVGIPDARYPVDNAPLVATASMFDQAIATSGRGPRDRILDGNRFSSTLSPRDGWPIEGTVSVTALASSAADADALATLLLTLPPDHAVAWADNHRVAARIQTSDRALVTQAASARIAQVDPKQSRTKGKSAVQWPKDWVALITFTAPPRQLVRDEHFRSPYMAMWITDLDNKPIRTLLLVGRESEWQRDNYIWWTTNDASVKQLMATRSMSTSGSGIYKVLWDGTNDQYEEMPGGSYVLHVETSRERGKHTHRSLTLNFSKGEKFSAELPSTEEAGGLRLEFYRP